MFLSGCLDAMRLLLFALLVGSAGATWTPSAAALAASADREIRVLHRHAKSNAFFYFLDDDDEAAAYAAQTPTEDDAVEVTGQVTGFNVELMEALASKAGWTVRYFVMCCEGYDCAANQTSGLIPKNTEVFEQYFQSNMTFDAVVSSFPMTVDTLPYLSWMDPPSLRTGFSAFALVPDGKKDDSLGDRLQNWTQPFSTDVWIALLVVVVAAGVLYALVVRDEAGDDAADDAFHGVYQAGATLTGAGGFEPSSRAGKAFVLVFSFFTLLIVSAYTANLTTFLTISAYRSQPIVRIQSFEELGKHPCVKASSTKAFLDHNYPNIRYVDVTELDGFDYDLEHYSQLFHFLLDGACDGVVTHTHYGRNTFIRDALNDGGTLGCDVEPVGPEEGEYVYSIPFRTDADDPLWAAASYAHAMLIDEYEKMPIEDKFFPVSPRVAAGCGTGTTDDDEDLVFHLRDMVGYFFVAAVGLSAVFLSIFVGKAARACRPPAAEPAEEDDKRDAADESFEAAAADEEVPPGDEDPLEAIRREIGSLRDDLLSSTSPRRLKPRPPRRSPPPRRRLKKSRLGPDDEIGPDDEMDIVHDQEEASWYC